MKAFAYQKYDVVAKYTAEQLIFLKALIEAGRMKSVVDRTYAFEQIPEAHRYVDTGQKVGHVAITVSH